MAATTSTSFFNFRSTNHESGGRTSSTHHGSSPSSSCSKLDGVAMWLINGVAAAFFASLERCSCIRIATEDDGEEVNNLPLIYNDGNFTRHDAADAIVSRRRAGKGNNKGGAGAFEEV